jgi:threonyl-tRNA synthetase
LIEKYAGAFPMWLAPEQIRVLPLSEKMLDKACEITETLKQYGLRAETDVRNEKIGYKIREAQLQKVPYMLVIGEREAEAGLVSVRSRKDGDIGAMTLDDFIAKALKEVAEKAR